MITEGFCPKMSEVWAIDLYLSAPPPQRKFGPSLCLGPTRMLTRNPIVLNFTHQ